MGCPDSCVGAGPCRVPQKLHLSSLDTYHKCIALWWWAQAAVASGPFSILGQRLASLLSDVHFRSLACNDLHWSECSALGGAYNGMLSYLLPGGILELSGADRAGELGPPASSASLPVWCQQDVEQESTF
jgi:hypothetical protein